MPLNVLEILADQHQAACLGCEGHPQALTPNLDRLARAGVRFTNAYTQNPICTPSRVSILSGQYCHNHGYYGLSGPRPSGLPSFLGHFRSRGYRTAGIGNLHTPATPRNWLADHVDLFDDTFESVDGEHERTPWYDRIRSKGLLEQEDFHFWDAHPELAQAAYQAFHAWRGAVEPRSWEAAARRAWRGYLACITHADHAVGLLLAHLDLAGLAASTIVVYHADHGGYSGAHGIQEKAPGICSEAVCRIPFLWRVPGGTEPGRVCAQLAENVDVAPTLAALCGLPRMDTADGKDLGALLRGADTAVRDVAVTEHPWSRAMRWGPWRFVHYPREMFGGRDVGELYDLAADPAEIRNRYGDPECRDVVSECRRLLLEWLIGTTRVVTVWPPAAMGAITDARRYDYRTAADGKESGAAGPALRLQRGQLNYL